ncbi:MAG: ATP-binding protein [Bacteroidetes bacterium]|nr:ATP-binding protein [Bacteroidota bacterium]
MEHPEAALILLRGLPGSGKSSLATLLCENGKYPVFSIDSYFTDPVTGAYAFDPYKNHLAYKQCEEQCEAAMKNGIQKIFVDNTFTIEWELEPYFKMAAANNYRVFAVTVENRHGGLNTHGITDEQLEKMAAKYKVKLV